MPIYEYICKNCGHQFDELQSMKENPLERCPSCGENALARLIGSGSGVIFKGSGFYHTDYKKSSPKSKQPAPTKKESETKAETKSADKPAEKAVKKESSKK